MMTADRMARMIGTDTSPKMMDTDRMAKMIEHR